MAQINTCLKRVFTAFNIFFAIIGGIIIGLALLVQFSTSLQGGENLMGRSTGLFVLYIVGVVTMVIAVLGAYGAHTESKGSLIVFLVCMVLGCLLIFTFAIPAAFIRPQLTGMMEETLRPFLPLDDSTDDVKNIANAFQKNFHCCGLFSYTDWETIPDSCLCSGEEEEEEGECRRISYKTFMQESIYSKTCFPIIARYVLFVVDIVFGVIFTLAILVFFGMILSSIMIHQMRHRSQPTILMKVPSIFSPPPPKYKELHNLPLY